MVFLHALAVAGQRTHATPAASFPRWSGPQSRLAFEAADTTAPRSVSNGATRSQRLTACRWAEASKFVSAAGALMRSPAFSGYSAHPTPRGFRSKRSSVASPVPPSAAGGLPAGRNYNRALSVNDPRDGTAVLQVACPMSQKTTGDTAAAARGFELGRLRGYRREAPGRIFLTAAPAGVAFAKGRSEIAVGSQG